MPPRFSSQQSFAKRLNVYVFLMRGYGTGVESHEKVRMNRDKCHAVTEKRIWPSVNRWKVQNPKNAIKDIWKTTLLKADRKKPFR